MDPRPTPTRGWTWAERLTLAGCDWLNLRFTTPFKLALDAAAPALLAEGVHPCPEYLGPSLLQSLLLKTNPLILQPGMAEAMWATLQSARLAGVRAGDFEDDYLHYLKSHCMADRAMVLQRTEASKVREGDFVLVDPYQVGAPLELEFIARLPGTHLRPHATHLEAPRRFQGWREPKHTTPTAAKRFFYAGRRDLEFEEILRRIDGPLDQVELAAHKEDLPLLLDLLATHQCPATFAEGLPLELSRPGQGLDGFLSWLEQGLCAYHIRELLIGNFIVAPPNSWTAAKILKGAQVSWGARDYELKLEAFAARAERDRGGLHSSEARLLAGWFREIIALFTWSEFNLHQFLNGLKTVVQKNIDHEEESTDLILWILDELKVLPAEGWTLTVAARLVRERIQAFRCSVSRPKPGHLHVTSHAEIGISGRPQVYLTGLEEGHWTLPVEDCVLSDAWRAELHPGLALSEDRYREHLFRVDERLTSLEGTVTFSFSSRDREGEQECFPSRLFFREAQSVAPELTSVSALWDWLGEPVQPWLEEEKELRRGPAEVVHRLFPDLARGHVAEAARASNAFTRYDGWVPSAAGMWDEMVFSVSRLQELAACPFRFFLQKGLRLYPMRLGLPQPDRWLDAATRGHILHEIYAHYGAAQREGKSVDLLELLDSALEKQLPPPTESVRQAEREALRNDLAHFIKLEGSRPGRRIVGVEVGFGLGPEDEPLSVPDPLLLDLGEGLELRLSGRIDRLDEQEDGFSVVDYKTGRKLELARQGLYQRGQLLQHGLYALAARQMVKGSVTESGYYFTSVNASFPWVRFPYPDLAALRRVVGLVVAPLKSGAFSHTHQSSDCQYCEYRAACHAHKAEHVKAKWEDERLGARRLLLEEP